MYGSNYNNYAFLFVCILLEILFRFLDSRLERPLLVHLQLGFLFNSLPKEVILAAELLPVVVSLLNFTPFCRHVILIHFDLLLFPLSCFLLLFS